MDERPTYGYRRIRRRHKPAAKGRRKAASQWQACAAGHAGQQTDARTAVPAAVRARTHDGVVIALRSNIRWCSDHFELACRNGEIVRVLFAIDACDREVMAWLATSAGISGEMVVALRRTLNSGSARRRIPSNGCPTTARLTSLRTRSTPQRPWASSFVSRRSVRRNPTASRRHSSKPSNATMLGCHSCRMAETVIALLPAWFEDYNEVHPHSGLKFLSPREFLRLSA